jgi:hypothetical protein
MKTRRTIYLIIYFTLLSKLGLAQTTFQKTFGGSLAEYCFSAKKTSDKGFVLAGFTKSYGLASNNFYIIKTDSVASVLWSKIYGGGNDDQAYCIQQTTDGGYIMAGYTRSFGVQYYDACLLKIDARGDTLWLKTYGGLNSEYGNNVIQTKDGGYIMTGYATDSTSMYIVKTDAQGNLLWQKLVGAGTGVTDGYCIKQTADKGYIITGYGSGFGEVNGDVFLIKTDSLANPVFTKTYGYKGADWGNFMCETTDGGYVIGGSCSTDSTGLDVDAYIIKTDANGDTLWTRAYGGPGNDYGQYIQQTTDGGYVLSGYSNSFGAGNYDAFLLKVNANGDTIFAKTFGGTGDDEANTVTQTSDGGYVLTGQTNSYGRGDYDFYLIKTDANGNSACQQTNVHLVNRTAKTRTVAASIWQITPSYVQLSAHSAIYTGSNPTDVCSSIGIATFGDKPINLQVFPNPNNGLFSVSFNNASEEKVKLCVQNLLGETVYAAYTVNGKEINLQHLINGTYFACIQTREKIYTEKIIIAK